MSARFSNSAALRLTLGRSRLRLVFHCLSGILALSALCLVADRGYPGLALVLVVPTICLMWNLRRDPAAGAQLHWQQGKWDLLQRGERLLIAPRAGTAVLPWVVHLSYATLPQGRSGGLWIYVDSLERQAWRQLRVRLTLQSYRGYRLPF